eukprot:scaffold98226_cov38-Prasinocladus_malaysianus.AAC.1
MFPLEQEAQRLGAEREACEAELERFAADSKSLAAEQAAEVRALAQSCIETRDDLADLVRATSTAVLSSDGVSVPSPAFLCSRLDIG